jgi:hypothetical protein
MLLDEQQIAAHADHLVKPQRGLVAAAVAATDRFKLQTECRGGIDHVTRHH